MAIQSKTAVESEYATKRAAILAYDDAAIAAELDSLIKFATKLRELATLLRAREAINDRPTASSLVNKLVDAADSIADTPDNIRSQFAVVKGLLADPVVPEPPVVP
jgi:hypothetical protein